LSDGRQRKWTARGELRDWVKAREYWDRAVQALELARIVSDADVQDRYVRIARHYRMLAEAEEQSASQKGVERRNMCKCRRHRSSW
jgi:hypothetical protein